MQDSTSDDYTEIFSLTISYNDLHSVQLKQIDLFNFIARLRGNAAEMQISLQH